MRAGIFQDQDGYRGGRDGKPAKIRWDRLILLAGLLTLWSLLIRAVV